MSLSPAAQACGSFSDGNVRLRSPSSPGCRLSRGRSAIVHCAGCCVYKAASFPSAATELDFPADIFIVIAIISIYLKGARFNFVIMLSLVFPASTALVFFVL